MSDWNRMVFGFCKFIGIAVLVLIAYSIICAIAPKLIDILKKKIQEKKDAALQKKETALRNELIQYDTTKLVAEIFYKDLLEILDKETQKMSSAIEKVIILFDIKTANGTVSSHVSSGYNSRYINFHRDLHKENMLKNEFENRIFSDAVAHILVNRLKSQSFNGAHCDAVKYQKWSIETIIEIELKIQNPNYLPPPPAQKWKKTTPTASQVTPAQPKHETKTIYAGRPAPKTAPAKSDTKPQAKSQPEKEQPKPTSDISLDDFNDNFDEWLKKRGG